MSDKEIGIGEFIVSLIKFFDFDGGFSGCLSILERHPDLLESEGIIMHYRRAACCAMD